MPADFPPSSLTFTVPAGPITVSSNIQLEFSAAIQAGSGKITITDGITQSYTGRDGSIHTRIVGASDTRVIDIGSSEVAINGDTLTINPGANLKLGLDYHVVIDAGAVLDMDDQSFTGLTQTGIYHFTAAAPVADTTGPSLLNMALADHTLAHGQATTLTLTFSEAVQSIALGDFDVEGGTLSDLSSANGITWTATFTADDVSTGHFWLDFENEAVRDLAGNPGYVYDSVQLMVDIPDLTISFAYDNGESDSDLVTDDGYQTIYVDPAEQPSATDRVEILINGTWHTAHREEGEGRDFFWLDAELSGSGEIVARLVSSSNTVKAEQSSDYVIDTTDPVWDPYVADLSLNIAKDTGTTGDNITQFTQVVIDVDLHTMSGLQVGDILSLHDLLYDGYEGYELGIRRSASHVVTDDDLNGDGKLSFQVEFDPDYDFPETSDGDFSLTLVVSDVAGNHKYSNNSLDLTIDRSAAYFEGMETSGDLSKLYLHFSEEVNPAGFKLINTNNNSEISITTAMISHVPETSTLEITLATPLLDGVQYRLEPDGDLYDRAGNLTLTSPLGFVTAHYGVDAELDSIAISHDSGAADGVTNIAAQTFSGSFDGQLHSGQFIEVSLDGGSSWTVAHVSGSTWSLEGTLASGENGVQARVNSGTTQGTAISASFVYQTAAPSLSSTPELDADDDHGINDGITNATTITVSPMVSGASGLHAGDRIELINSSNTVLGYYTLSSADFGAYGTVNHDIDITLGTGEHEIRARVIDGAGNVGTAGGTLTVTIDNTAPGLGSSPVLLYNGSPDGDNISTSTNVTMRALLATESGYRAGDEIEIIDSSNHVLGAHTITSSDFDSYGHIEDIDIGLSPLDEGSHSLRVRVTDVAGNTDTSSATTITVNLPPPDTTPPTALIDVDSLSYDSSTGVVEFDLTGDYSDAIVEYTLNLEDWDEASGTGAHREYVYGDPPYPFFLPGAVLRVVDAAGNVGSGVAGLPHGSIIYIGTETNSIVSSIGYDAVFAQGGDDEILFDQLSDFDFVDGGSGTDKLSFVGSFSFDTGDLTAKINDIEQLELNGDIDFEVGSAAALQALGISRIDGIAAASVDLSAGNWVEDGTIEDPLSSITYTRYTLDNVTLEIADLVGVILGTA